MEELSLAIEYQGKQHDAPVPYFGGESAFAEAKRRDRRKKMLCSRHGVRVLYVREGYDIEAIKAQVRDACGVRRE